MITRSIVHVNRKFSLVMQRMIYDPNLPGIKYTTPIPSTIGIESPQKTDQLLSQKLKKLLNTEEKVYVEEKTEKNYNTETSYNNRED